MPMTVLVEDYWREISGGLTEHGIPVRHFVLHVDPTTLRDRIENDTDLGPSPLRFAYMQPYAEGSPVPGCTMRLRLSTPRTSPPIRLHSESQNQC